MLTCSIAPSAAPFSAVVGTDDEQVEATGRTAGTVLGVRRRQGSLASVAQASGDAEGGAVNHSQAMDFQAGLAGWIKSPGARKYIHEFFGGNQADAISAMSTEFGETFYWSRDTSAVVDASRETIPEWHLTPDLLPAYFGFMVFDHEFSLPAIYDRTGEAIQERVSAIGWVVISKHDGSEFVAMPLGSPPITHDDEVSFMTFGRIGGIDRVVPTAIHRWKFGETWYETARREDDEPSEYRLVRTRLIASALAFISQPFMSSAPQNVDRATRRRMAREHWTHDPIVRVVQLRRILNQQHREHGSDPVEWSCSWVVRGHWRQQACGPNYAERRPVFVLPYVKGDPEKPLKAPAERVFAVVR